MQHTDNHRSYWRKNRLVIAALLLVWFGVTFGVSFFARALSFNFFGWPFSFWMAAQGALIIYCLIIGFYAWYMGRLDIAHGVEEEEDEGGQ
jgi:putative solute:sodium symporter small subunit